MCNYVKIKRTSLFVILSLILSCSKKKVELCPENYLEIVRVNRSQFIKKLEKGSLDEIKRILKEGIWKISDPIPDYKGKTPLHVATEAGNEKVVKFLINILININTSANTNLIDVEDKEGYTPLHGAAENGHEKIVKLLLQERVNIEAEDKAGHTPLHLAALYGKKEVVEELVKHNPKPNISKKDKDGCTPLHLATLLPSKEVLELLLEEGAQVDAEKSGDKPRCIKHAIKIIQR